jgi:hypothetical protein
MLRSLLLLAACALGTRAAIEADPDTMKSVAVGTMPLHEGYMHR